MGHDPAVLVRPLGLVLKAGAWHLVVMGAGEPEVLGLDELRATRLTTQPFTPPSGFDLAAFWQRHCAASSTSL